MDGSNIFCCGSHPKPILLHFHNNFQAGAPRSGLLFGEDLIAKAITRVTKVVRISLVRFSEVAHKVVSVFLQPARPSTVLGVLVFVRPFILLQSFCD